MLRFNILIFFLFWNIHPFFSQKIDTTDLLKAKNFLFIEDVKRQAFKDLGEELKGKFYETWNDKDDPSYYLYVSRSDTVMCAPNTGGMDKGYPFMLMRNEEDTKTFYAMYAKMGLQPFVYKTYANSAVQITGHFLNYSNPSKCFIIYHELMHHYISQNNLKIPYDINEALCDVVANCGTLNYAKSTFKLNLNETQNEVEVTETIYARLNECLSKITTRNKNIADDQSKFQNELKDILKRAGNFQLDRFNYKVNNGFLLKNSSYSRNYFLLKKVLIKQGSIMKLLEIIKAHSGKSDYLLYLEQFT